MTAFVCEAHKTFGVGFDNEISYVKLTYDFAQDGGAYNGNTYDLGTTEDDILIVRGIVHIETAIVGTSSTITLGVNDEDADAFLAAVAEGTLVQNYAIDTTAGQSLWVPSGDTIRMSIGTADLTAGKLHLHLFYVKP
jgi:hypothetical protein